MDYFEKHAISILNKLSQRPHQKLSRPVMIFGPGNHGSVFHHLVCVDLIFGRFETKIQSEITFCKNFLDMVYFLVIKSFVILYFSILEMFFVHLYAAA